ncbi:MAG: PaaI family thioesterase [Pseudomonadota bacterium]
MGTHTFSQWLAARVEADDWAAIEDRFNDTAVARDLGPEIVLADPDRPRCVISKEKPIHSGGVGQDFTNGVIIAGVFDFVLGLTALRYTGEGNFATTSLNIRMLKAVEKGGVYAVGEVSRRIGRTIFAEATLYNGRDEPCSFATGEVRVGIR